MHPRKAHFHEGARLLAGVLVVDGRLLHIALHEADDGAFLQVDGREEDHGADGESLNLLP